MVTAAAADAMKEAHSTPPATVGTAAAVVTRQAAGWHGEAALLAGGRSRRMGGVDKAWLDWGGQPLWRHQAATIGALNPQRCWLLRRPDQAEMRPLPDGWTLAEDQPGCGHPMQALLPVIRGLAPGHPLLVLPVDMPRLDAGWLRAELLSACGHGHDHDRGAVLWNDGRYQPLVACYPAGMAGLIERWVAAGNYRWQDLLAEAERAGLMRRVVVDDAAAAMRLVNLNSPEDWRRLQGTAIAPVQRWRPGSGQDAEAGGQPVGGPEVDDEVVVESPLEIRVNGRSIAVVMRTPGDDEELAAGFLISEGVVRCRADLFEVSTCPSHRDARRTRGAEAMDNQIMLAPDDGAVVDVILARTGVDLEALTRHVFAASSCGICGKATIDAVMRAMPPLAVDDQQRVDPAVLARLPAVLRRGQVVFERTGGLHGAALFEAAGRLVHLREDVGRHNAVDKLLGRLVLDDALPAAGLILMVSGRVSFEIMQKALAAGVPVVAAVSAPSSLAIDFARRSGQTLIGFLRGNRFNVYAGAGRIAGG